MLSRMSNLFLSIVDTTFSEACLFAKHISDKINIYMITHSLIRYCFPLVIHWSMQMLDWTLFLTNVTLISRMVIYCVWLLYSWKTNWRLITKTASWWWWGGGGIEFLLRFHIIISWWSVITVFVKTNRNSALWMHNKRQRKKEVIIKLCASTLIPLIWEVV